MNKKVLVIAYYFPPMENIGILRTLRYVKHLPSFGWDPIVLTVRKGAYWDQKVYYKQENFECEDIPYKVIRTGFF